MAPNNLSEFGQAWWTETKKKVKNAYVFIDPVTCECLHWNGGAVSILEAGAICIKEFSTFEVVPQGAKKAVFISGTALHGTAYNILEHLIKGSSLEYCVIITTAHLSVHHLLRWGGRDGHELEAFQKIEEDVLSWMGNLNYTVEIFNYPLSTIHPTKESFLMPFARPIEPVFPSDLDYINEQLLLFHSKTEAQSVRSVNDLTFSSLPIDLQSKVRQFTCTFNQLLQHVNAKEDIFTVGSFSRIVGTELEALGAARTRRKSTTNRISVVFVDRVLDMAIPTKLSSEGVYDRLLHTLDRLHEQSNDVAVKMADNAQADASEAPGCIAPQCDWEDGWKLMDHLFHRNIHQSAERIAFDLIQDGDDDEIDHALPDLLALRSNDWDFIEKFPLLYQAGRAVVQSQTSSRVKQLEALEGIRKSLVESIDDFDSPSPLVQILHMLKSRHDSNHSLDDILVLLTHLYAMAGEDYEELFPADLEDRLKSLLGESLVTDCDHLSDPLQDFVGIPVDEVRAHRAAQTIVEHLHYISQARSNLRRYRTLRQRRNAAMPLECVGLLQQLVDDIFDPSVIDNPDVEHKSGGLKDLLKTGFSMFVNVRKPRPSDNPTIILYVCGGVRPDEIRLVRELCRQKSPSTTVIVGSSHLLSARDSLHCVLKKNIS